MNDTLYVGDIPLNYKYARFSNSYIDLYKVANPEGLTDYYRIYLYDNTFQCDHLSGNYTGYNTITTTEVKTTNDWHYRRDIANIYFGGLVHVLLIVFIVNLVTSVFKKGGALGGLF